MYSYNMTDEQRMLTDTVNRFATRTMRKVYREAEEEGAIPAGIVDTGWELGLLPASLPEDYGGFGEYSVLNGALYAEELGYGDLAITLDLLHPNQVAIPILLCGTEEQKEQYLPLFCDEDIPKATAAFLEPTILFDAEDLNTTALQDGDQYLISGKKTMVIDADDAELLLVYAKDETDGQTQAFLVPTDSPGVTIGDRDKWMGLNALKTYTVEFENVAVPHMNRLGGEQGIDLQKILNSSRIGQAAVGVGLARAAYEYALDYAKEREAFGEPIAHRQSIAFMLADMAIEVDAARMLLWEAAWKLDNNDSSPHASYLAAQYAADMTLTVTDNAVQILGGHGYIREFPVELWLRNGRGITTLLGCVIV